MRKRSKVQRMGLALLLCGSLFSSVHGHEEPHIRGALQQCQADIGALDEIMRLQDKRISLMQETQASLKRTIAANDEALSIYEETMPYCLELKEQLEECQAGGK